jgi:uncharacterized membrane protein HdeD (DUF308 family)
MKKRKSEREKKIVNNVNKNIPIGIKILAILGYICSIFFLVVGILSLIISIGIAMSSGSVPLPPNFPPEFVNLFTQYLVPFLITMSIVFIITGILGILVSRALWKGKNWARILLIVISIIGVISNIMEIIKGNFSSIISFAINIVIVWYLLGNKKVQKYFKNK